VILSNLGGVTGERYLETRSRGRAELGRHHQRFAALRDEFVVNLKYNTARAYAGDLDHLFDWASDRGQSVLELTESDLQEYLVELVGRPYTPNTLVRKRTALQGFYDLAFEKKAITSSPMGSWAPVKR
jgi:site-specific recombinase XerD